jgi:hypothetical protein
MWISNNLLINRADLISEEYNYAPLVGLIRSLNWNLIALMLWAIKSCITMPECFRGLGNFSCPKDPAAGLHPGYELSGARSAPYEN